MIRSTNKTPLPDMAYAWLRDTGMPSTRRELLAEAIALVALFLTLSVSLVIAMLPGTARAATAAAPAPSLELAAFRVVAATAVQPEHLVAAAQARAGDRLEYVATYRNPTAATLHQVQVTVPVPATGVEYLLESASPHADLASADGKQYAPLPLMRTETLADGRQVSKPAPGADYRFLRWDLGDVPAGAVRTLRSRVQLTATSAAH